MLLSAALSGWNISGHPGYLHSAGEALPQIRLDIISALDVIR